MANDEEYAAALAEAQAKQEKTGGQDAEDVPAMTAYTPEVEELRKVINELRILRTLFIQSKSEKGAPTVKPVLLGGPKTALQYAMRRAEYLRKKAKHEALVARVLPHRRKEPPVG